MKSSSAISTFILLWIFAFGAYVGHYYDTNPEVDHTEIIAETQAAMIKNISHKPYVILEISDIVRDSEAAVPYLREGWEIVAMLGNPKDENLIMILRNPEMPK